MRDLVDGSKVEGIMVRENESMAGMCHGGYDVWHDYCPIRDALYCASPATMPRIDRR